MNYKAKIRIPTDTYAYVEFEVEGNLEEISKVYDEAKAVLEPKEGVNTKDWSVIRNKYFDSGEVAVEDYEKLSYYQKGIINEIKLARKSNK